MLQPAVRPGRHSLRLQRMLNMLVATALVLLALGHSASGRSDGTLSDRSLYVGHSKGFPSMTAHVLGTGNLITMTPRFAPGHLFEGAPNRSYYELSQFNPDTFAASPDGNVLVFATRGEQCCVRWLDGELFAINADGSDVRRLSRTDNLDEKNPVFSPDGKLIAYLQDAVTSRPTGIYHQVSLALMNADGSGQRTLARVRGGKYGANAANITVSWNRDSRTILFTSDDTSERSQLTDIASGATRPLSGTGAQFSPDGSQIALFYRSQVYAGTVDQIAKPGYWKTLRPRLRIERRNGVPFKIPYDFFWRQDGSIFSTTYFSTGKKTGSCRYRSDLAISTRSGKRVIAKGVCGGGQLRPSPNGMATLWSAGQGGPRDVVFSSTSSWKPRSAPGICIAAPCIWGYQPTVRRSGI